jgi:cold-inducible RNA-binding protein
MILTCYLDCLFVRLCATVQANVSRESIDLSKKVYVGNLSFQATEDEVRDLFAQYGNIESIAMITDRDTGRFRGFCFVEMADGEADAAIAALDGQEVGGRNLRVNEARPRENRGGGGSRGGGSRGGGNRRDNFGGGNRRNNFPDSGGGSGNRRW